MIFERDEMNVKTVRNMRFFLLDWVLAVSGPMYVCVHVSIVDFERLC